MMSLALVAAFVVGAPDTQDGTTPVIVWRTYSEALKQQKSAKKPIAVFFGEGTNGQRKAVTGSLSQKSEELLANNYLAVFVDTNTQEGRRWAAQTFEMTKNVGVVLSDRTGTFQMLFHEGTIGAAVLETQLDRALNTDARVSFYQPPARSNPAPAPTAQHDANPNRR